MGKPISIAVIVFHQGSYLLGSGIGADRIILYSFFASSTFSEILSIFCRVSSICKEDGKKNGEVLQPLDKSQSRMTFCHDNL